MSESDFVEAREQGFGCLTAHGKRKGDFTELEWFLLGLSGKGFKHPRGLPFALFLCLFPLAGGVSSLPSAKFQWQNPPAVQKRFEQQLLRPHPAWMVSALFGIGHRFALAV